MKMMKRLCRFMLPFVLIACAADGQKQGIAGEYPADRYLRAEGIGQTEGEARSSAIGELSRIFESRVYSDTLDRLSSVIDQAGAETSTQSVESKVRVVSDVELTGAEIAGTWKAGDGYRALAVLDRAKAKDKWVRDLYDIDGRIEAKAKAAKAMKSRLLQYRALRSAADMWIEREVIVSRLGVVGFRITGVQEYEIKDIHSSMAALRTAMPVYIDIQGNLSGRVRSSVAEALGRGGFVGTGDRTLGAVLVIGTVEIEPVRFEGSDLVYARAVVSLSIVDTDSGLTIGEIMQNKRAAHLTGAEAEEKAILKAVGLISERITELLEKEAP